MILAAPSCLIEQPWQVRFIPFYLKIGCVSGAQGCGSCRFATAVRDRPERDFQTLLYSFRYFCRMGSAAKWKDA